MSAVTSPQNLLITLLVTESRGSPIFLACKKLPLLLWGPLFVEAPVRPNMLNIPKSAAGCNFWKPWPGERTRVTARGFVVVGAGGVRAAERTRHHVDLYHVKHRHSVWCPRDVSPRHLWDSNSRQRLINMLSITSWDRETAVIKLSLSLKLFTVHWLLVARPDWMLWIIRSWHSLFVRCTWYVLHFIACSK